MDVSKKNNHNLAVRDPVRSAQPFQQPILLLRHNLLMTIR